MNPNNQIRCPRCCLMCQSYDKFKDHMEQHNDGSWNGWNLDMSVALVQARPPGTLPPQTMNLYPDPLQLTLAPPSVSAHTCSTKCASNLQETANQKEKVSTSLRLGSRPE
ncbi:hypothetical protein CTI12_AA317930 [Artemisia annua]|uniref:Uncharacterized protein n=1 Tax=Artemisia annua TaxID=35608 RepID=A0A2U1N202_ARTAN|nr:hypothetical protein CTI12_AA317930 [Artemisia annua]